MLVQIKGTFVLKLSENEQIPMHCRLQYSVYFHSPPPPNPLTCILQCLIMQYTNRKNTKELSLDDREVDQSTRTAFAL
jgi:hypothetical protein